MSGPSFLTQVRQMCLYRAENWRQRQTDRHICALGDRKMKEKKTLKESPRSVLHAERPQERQSPSLTYARCRPACRALERRRRCGHQGRIFHISNTLDSQTFAYNCFGKTSKKTHTMCLFVPFSCAFNSTASSSENRKYPRSNGC